ncbi:MAG: hypothetical protein PSY12_03330 [bacterium]|nr:hypothetical protein [bacterium]
MIDVPPQSVVHAEQVIERKLIDCGLEAKGFSVKYEDYLQSIEIAIGPEAMASENQLQCIHQATGHEIVTFIGNAPLQARYDKFLSDLYRPQMVTEATNNIKKLGLLKNFPKRSSFDSLTEYAHALERHCGVAQGSVLKVVDDGVSFAPPREPNYQKFSKLYSKILAAVMYASATGDVEKMGFIGNEAVSATDGSDVQPR